MKYQWTVSVFKAPHGDSSEIFQHLEHLRSQEDLSIDFLFKDAKRASSPLHSLVEWDRNVAAERHQKGQLRRAITSIVKVNPQGKASRVYIGVRNANHPEEPRHYDLVERVLRNPELRKPYARRALNELARWRMVYDDFPELQRTIREMDRTLKTVIRPALARMES